MGTLSQEVFERMVDFYEYSQMWPCKKECVTIKMHSQTRRNI